MREFNFHAILMESESRPLGRHESTEKDNNLKIRHWETVRSDVRNYLNEEGHD